jgi:hypothetical protein
LETFSQCCILAAVESSSKRHFLKQKDIQIQKFFALKDHHQTTTTPKAIEGSEKFVLNLPEDVLTESEESVLKRRLNFAVTTRVSNLEMVCVAESARSKLPPTPHPGDGVLLENLILEKSRSLTSSMTRKE